MQEPNCKYIALGVVTTDYNSGEGGTSIGMEWTLQETGTDGSIFLIQRRGILCPRKSMCGDCYDIVWPDDKTDWQAPGRHMLGGKDLRARQGATGTRTSWAPLAFRLLLMFALPALIAAPNGELARTSPRWSVYGSRRFAAATWRAGDALRVHAR